MGGLRQLPAVKFWNTSDLGVWKARVVIQGFKEDKEELDGPRFIHSSNVVGLVAVHRAKWGGLREVDLVLLRKLGLGAPHTHQGTQRNQNFLGTQGETSVLDQVKSARSCQ